MQCQSSAGFSVPDTWTDNAVRCAVLSLLKETSQSTLAKSCPLTQSTISNIANWKYGNKLSLEKCREFGEWYKHKATIVKDFPCEKSIPKDTRLTFHPEHEVPQMRKWYKSCKNPTDSKLKFFTGELNKGHVRQERPKVTVAKVKIWWKNERQREKRMNQKKLPTTTEESDETSQESLQHSSDIEKTRSLLSNDLDKTRSLLLCELEKSSSLLGFETSENVSHLMYGTVGEDLSEDVSHISASHTVTMAGDSHSSGKVSVSHDVASHTAAMQSVHRRLQQESHDLSQSHGLAEDTGWPQNT